jgi:hypothetical protein
MPPVAAAAGWVGANLVPIGVATAAGAMVYSTVEQSKQAKAAEEEAKKQRKLQEQLGMAQLEAGEYFNELNYKQMELQAQASSISTLANLIAQQKASASQQPTVFTLPAAKTYDPITKINNAIHEMITGS